MYQKVLYVSLFNKYCEDLLRLLRNYGVDMTRANTMFDQLRQVDENLPMQLYIDFVTIEMHEYLTTKDDNIFTSFTFDDMSNIWHCVFQAIKQAWATSLTSEAKRLIWVLLQQLVAIRGKC